MRKHVTISIMCAHIVMFQFNMADELRVEPFWGNNGIAFAFREEE